MRHTLNLEMEASDWLRVFPIPPILLFSPLDNNRAHLHNNRVGGVPHTAIKHALLRNLSVNQNK